MKAKLGIGLVSGLGISAHEQIRYFSEVGFDSAFVSDVPCDLIGSLCRVAKECGIGMSSVHAPFMKIDKLWHGEDECDAVEAELVDYIRACHDSEIPVLVSHVIIGFDRHEPNGKGIEAFLRLSDEARRLGVTLAFENTEGEEYLKAVMDATSGLAGIGFCYDTGHGMCYNAKSDMLKLYGDRLVYTHINDNLGVSDKGGAITWLDDLHLLPFDGVLDMEKCMADIAKTGYNGELTFELSVKSKPGRNENDRYAAMGPKTYIKEAYERAVRVRDIFDSEKIKNNKNRT